MNGGYAPIPNSLCTAPISVHAKLLWVYLMTLPEESDTSSRALGEGLGMHRETVSGCTKELVDAKMVLVTKTSLGSFDYTLLAPSDWVFLEAAVKTDMSAKPASPGWFKPQGGVDITDNTYNTYLNKKEERVLSGVKQDITPHEAADVFEYWNKIIEKPKVQKLSDSRKAKLRKRLKDETFAANWRSIIDRIAASRFLSGVNDRNWRADFDWLIENDHNYLKVLEGKYDDSSSAKLEWI
jgi:hypothetical protein